MSYQIGYEALDNHWQVIKEYNGEPKIVDRFRSRNQAEAFVERRTAVWGGENNSEKEG